MHFNYLFVIYLISSTYCLDSAEQSYSISTQDDMSNRLSALDAKLSSLSGLLSNIPTPSSKIASDGVDLRDYMYRDAMVFQDIFNAYNSNIFTKMGSPKGWDETSYVNSPWNLRHILNIGVGINRNGHGIKVNIPQGYDVIWLRVLSDRWALFRVCPFNDLNQPNFTPQQEVERYGTGYRNLNNISPDGAAPDSQWNVHMWMAFPVRDGATAYAVHSEANSDDWISGIAFSKNIWNHAYNSAIAYYWKINGGDPLGWAGENWNNDHIGNVPTSTAFQINVPVVFSGKDKLLYIIERNDVRQGQNHSKLYVNNVQVERFRDSWKNNPFSVHFNSKIYCRYYATRVAASLINAGDKFIKVRIDRNVNDDGIYFREIGTHDYN